MLCLRTVCYVRGRGEETETEGKLRVYIFLHDTIGSE
jgi:hypothetical protein